jgi:hypothetical protein
MKTNDMFTIRNPSRVPSHSPVPSSVGYLALFFATIALLLATVAAWITHIVVCIKASAWFLLLFGILAPPIGIVHGVGVWLGVF